MLALQLLVSGIAIGSLYSLTAVGFALIFGTTRIFHIAHGATFMVAAYCYVWGQRYSFVVGILAALVGALIFGYLVYRFIYTTIQKTRNSFFTLFVASFGIVIVAQNAISLIAGSDTKLLSGSISNPANIGAIQIPWALIIGFIVSAVALLGLREFLRRTVAGAQIRALADDAELVRMVGLNARRYSTLTILIGSALVVPAALLTTYQQGVSPTTGISIATVALVSAIAGGVGSLPGAAVGAMIFGIAEQITTLWLPAQWSDAIAYGALLVLLVAFPSGLVGKLRTA
jgi:branched-chain amino acid transport system permease protein